MKKIIALSALALNCLFVSAQDFAGYRTSNYTGVTGAFFNPANIVGSPYRFDFSLFAMQALVGNDQASFKLNDLSASFSGDSFSDQIFGKDAGNANGLANISVGLPSFMFNLGPKMSIAFTSRARVVANINDMNGKLVKKITEDFENDPELPYTLASTDNMLINMSGWTEFGGVLARELYNDGKNKIKAGITVKYLAGVANAHVNIGNLNGTMDADIIAQDAYLANTSGTLALGFSGVNFAEFEAGDITKFNGSGMGADIGFVYEMSKGADSVNIGSTKRPGYKLKIGVSLLDVGKISFTRDQARSGAYNIGINGTERYYFSNLEGLDLDNYRDEFSGQPQYFTPVAGSTDESYSVSLPTTLQLEADYQLNKRVYINASGQFAMSSNSSDIYNAQFYNSITITPRLEGDGFGIFFPINSNSLTKTNIGAGLRFGPLVVGSGSAISALTGSSKQADLYLGLRFGLLKK